jgi:hypothetical protein
MLDPTAVWRGWSLLFSLSSQLYYLTNCVIALHKFHNTEHLRKAGRTFSLQLRFRAKSYLDCFFLHCCAVNNILPKITHTFHMRQHDVEQTGHYFEITAARTVPGN